MRFFAALSRYQVYGASGKSRALQGHGKIFGTPRGRSPAPAGTLEHLGLAAEHKLFDDMRHTLVVVLQRQPEL